MSQYTIANALEDLIYKARNEVRKKRFHGFLNSQFGNHDFSIVRYNNSSYLPNTGLAIWYWEHLTFKPVLVPVFDDQDKIVKLQIGKWEFGGFKIQAEVEVQDFSVSWFLAQFTGD